MNAKVKEYANSHKVLTLQITRNNFVEIMQGRQKVEHRYIYPSNANKYIAEMENEDEDPKPRHYDALYLINGRRQNAPRMLVEVKDAEFVICIDDEGNDITFVEDGVEYYECQVWYHLGAVLDVENIKIENK